MHCSSWSIFTTAIIVSFVSMCWEYFFNVKLFYFVDIYMNNIKYDENNLFTCLLL